MENNLPKKKPPTFKELVVPSIQSTNALTMNLKMKKVAEYFFWKFQIVFVERYNHYWLWNKSGEEVEYSIRFARRSGKLEMLRGQNHKKKKKVSLKKLVRTQRIRSEGFERVAYDPKSVEKFGGIVE